jgi:hypothetical protein
LFDSEGEALASPKLISIKPELPNINQ